MDDATLFGLLLGMSCFAVGFLLGRWGEARLWRGKGDHEYMNTMASGGALYHVKREPLVYIRRREAQP